MISITWIASFLISCPPVFGWKDRDRDKNSCSLNRLLSYRIYSSMGSFFLPCIVMIFVYLRIFKTINDREKYLKSNTFSYMHSNIQTRNQKSQKNTKLLSFKSKKSSTRTNHSMESNNNLDANNCLIGEELAELKEINTPKIKNNNNNNENNSKNSTETDTKLNHLICCTKSRNSPNLSNYSININDVYLLDNKQKRKITATTLPNNLVGYKLATNNSNYELNNEINSLSSSTKVKRSLFKINKELNKSEDSNLYSSGSNLNNKQCVQQATTRDTRQTNSSPSNSKHEQTRLARENKATKTLAIVVSCFILSWLPFFIMYVLESILEPGAISKSLADSITWLGYFNSAINPFI